MLKGRLKHYCFATIKPLAFFWIFYGTAQYVTERMVMAEIYPAQNIFHKKKLNQKKRVRIALEKALAFQDKVQLEPIVLKKNGMAFHGWILFDPKQKENGKWVLQATGNKAAVEEYIPRIQERYALVGYNTLLINNPGVGESQGTSTPKTIGQVQELALSYLENTVGAKKIVLAGHSLGGAAIGQAILQHTFKPNIQYLVIQQMTFGKLSKVAKQMKPSLKALIKPVVYWTGLEMDTTAASRKLAELNIEEYIINKKIAAKYLHDGVIAGRVSLGHSLHKLGISHLKTTHYPNFSLDFSHNCAKYLDLTAKIIDSWDQKEV